MSMAIKYAMQKKKRCMAEGGDVDMLEEKPMNPLAKGMKKAFHQDGYAEGGEVEHEDDLISRIMKRRMAQGGEAADLEPNEFDELAGVEDHEADYTGASSGDEMGDKQVEEDDRDLVARIMRSRKLRDKNPRPA